MEQVVNIKDFIIDLSDTKTKETTNKKEQSEVSLEILLQNNSDFILKKVTKTSEKLFVFLLSQNLFYIKEKNKVTPLNSKSLKRFFNNVHSDYLNIRLEQVEWLKYPKSIKNNIDLLAQIIKDKNMQELYKYGVIYSYDTKYLKKFLDTHPKLLRNIYQVYREKYNNNIPISFITVVEFIFGVLKAVDYNMAMFYLEKFRDSNTMITSSTMYMGGKGYVNVIYELLRNENYNLNPKRLAEYLFEDLYEQGIDALNQDIFTIYNDYLNMNYLMYGEIKDKYPKYLKTQHDIVTLKFNHYMKYKKENIYITVSQQYRNLAYSDTQYAIIIPENTQDIIDEGVTLNHCVASYIKQILKNETFVVFMRQQNDISTPYITIEVRDKYIIQARGKHNRPVTEEERKFIEKWATEKGLQLRF